MSKAEDRYLEHFQDGRVRNCSNKDAFLYGYHQAEKDLELGWEDIKLLDKIFMYERVKSGLILGKEEYEKILKRYKDLKK